MRNWVSPSGLAVPPPPNCISPRRQASASAAVIAPCVLTTDQCCRDIHGLVNTNPAHHRTGLDPSADQGGMAAIAGVAGISGLLSWGCGAVFAPLRRANQMRRSWFLGRPAESKRTQQCKKGHWRHQHDAGGKRPTCRMDRSAGSRVVRSGAGAPRAGSPTAISPRGVCVPTAAPPRGVKTRTSKRGRCSARVITHVFVHISSSAALLGTRSCVRSSAAIVVAYALAAGGEA